MKKTATLALAGLFMAASIMGAAYSQGKGQGANGKAQGQNQAQKQNNKQVQPGVCPFGGPGLGAGAGAGQGGWWNRVSPKTAEEQAFVAQVAAAHNQIRAGMQQAAQMRQNGAPAADIARVEQQVATLRSQLQAYLEDNRAMLTSLGVPEGRGVCDGTGPAGKSGTCPLGGPGMGAGARQGQGQGMGKGAGRGQGRGGNGQGRGQGQGLRDGTGPNPNCPIKR